MILLLFNKYEISRIKYRGFLFILFAYRTFSATFNTKLAIQHSGFSILSSPGYCKENMTFSQLLGDLVTVT